VEVCVLLFAGIEQGRRGGSAGVRKGLKASEPSMILGPLFDGQLNGPVFKG
jgi:hypothetical protein